MDLDLIRRLHRKVNIVLVIGKADCLNKTEVRKLKERILQDLEDNHIQLYQFPECDSDEDDDFKQQDRELKASIPFAVVGSNTILEVAGKKVRGRQYPWGVVNVEDAEHSDFIKLRTFLISTHMQDLKDTTQVSCGPSSSDESLKSLISFRLLLGCALRELSGSVHLTDIATCAA